MRADLLLLLTAFIWGTAFIAQKNANASMPPLTFVGARFLLSAIALAPFAWREAGRHRDAVSRADLGLALLVGLCLFVGAALQQIGLKVTTATNAGFLTALYVVIVPFAVWALGGGRPRVAVVLAAGVCVCGAWLLADPAQLQSWSTGDALVLASDLPWALGIALIPIFLRRAQRPYLLCFVQYLVTAVLGLGAGLLREPIAWPGIAAAAPAIMYAGVISGGVAYSPLAPTVLRARALAR
jgi:drug/metabolite transporter (DMT)-like permease